MFMYIGSQKFRLDKWYDFHERLYHTKQAFKQGPIDQHDIN